ncbi:conserved hypothetical protein [Vibrio nigripulchritudo SOn1]|uniref:Uncharacterized protein n=1 Tax=Vibrio nigripulchritudo SOn1 TaxID=1238450 RepID=A0AAV2VPM3_9VIBR|nr:hypothetical protein [Vibrio nigripulchritudo]CCO46647.1 conserved hypothetical protein [Vibrio nigripulchritudo SOn1]
MLSGLDKLKLAKEIRELRSQIRSTSLKGIEKLNLAKRIKEIRTEIFGAATQATSQLDDLINGKFDHLDPAKFIATVRDISEKYGEFESVKQPVSNYVKKRLPA